ncbi:hypothetical protein WJX75_008965 [Coccomyxa subellipsoidea]|uniref:GILT-domain-containing protein n=1 Tax=Coccomyxa subellipsoidea TaxID=248742 RepID=A0ABR2Z162_9CHLO
MYIALGSAGCTARLVSQDKVTVGFYEESLCPYCAQFTTKVAAPLFENGLSDYIEFDLVPYGNAKNTSEGLVCQHGEAECRLNRVFACAIDQAKHQEDWFPFIACVEGQYGPSIEDSVASCADAAGLDYGDITDCATGEQGDELERTAAEATDALVPKHLYVPWVTVNGIPLLDDYANLQTYICVALHENLRPDVCFESAANQITGYSWHSTSFLKQAASALLSTFKWH